MEEVKKRLFIYQNMTIRSRNFLGRIYFSFHKGNEEYTLKRNYASVEKDTSGRTYYKFEDSDVSDYNVGEAYSQGVKVTTEVARTMWKNLKKDKFFP